jgi:flagellar hook protein FlgE
MTQGLFTAATGIRVNQTSLDVISNNIANVNTLAFKGSKANFSNAFYRSIYGGGAPTNLRGGSNPVLLGNGAQLSDITLNFNQGGTQFTGRTTDLMISGQGFFSVEEINPATGEQGNYLTRAGNFSLDASGSLVTASGNKVLGTSMLLGNSPATSMPINVPQTFKIAKFFDANNQLLDTAVGQTASTNADFATYATSNSIAAATTQTVTATLTNFTIGPTGAITATYSNGDRITVRPNPDGTNGKTELIHLPAEGGTYGGVNSTTGAVGSFGQLGGNNAVFEARNGGNPMEGMQLQIASAIVTNPNGLVQNGKNGYMQGPNSGAITYSLPGLGSFGEVQSGVLESSNVDLAQEFTNLVVAQRGLEASSRMVRAQSEVLQNIIQSL